jgi:hypothetical protein
VNGEALLDQFKELHQILLDIPNIASLFVSHQHFDDQFQASNVVGLQCNTESPSSLELSLGYWEIIRK